MVLDVVKHSHAANATGESLWVHDARATLSKAQGAPISDRQWNVVEKKMANKFKTVLRRPDTNTKASYACLASCTFVPLLS